MKLVLTFLFSFVFVINTLAQTRTVGVNSSGNITAPTNFWALNFPISNSVFVSINGNDSTGARATYKPFRTITAAKNGATNGDTIFVYPGFYGATNNVARSNINWYLFPGATIASTNVAIITNSGTCRGLFDDLDEAVKFTVGGYGDLFYYGGIAQYDSVGFAVKNWNTTFKGMVYLQNSNSAVSITCRSASMYCMGADNSTVIPTVFWIKDCTNFTLNCDYIEDTGWGTQVQIGEDEFMTPVYADPTVSGIYWELGEMYAHVKRISVTTYPVYLSQPAGSTHNTDFWGTFGLLENNSLGTVIYMSGGGTSLDWRSWITVDYIKGYLAVAGYGGPVNGKHYLNAKKVSGSAGLLLGGNATGTNRFWGDIQKISARGDRAISMPVTATNCIAHLKIHEIENENGLTYNINQNAGVLYLDSQTLDSSATTASITVTGVNTKLYYKPSAYVAATLTSGTYTNLGHESMIAIPNGSVRTNKLVSAKNFPYHEVTIQDSGFTASGTNIWVESIGGQTINGGPVRTNIANNGGSITLIPGGVGGTNWVIKARFP